MYRNNSMMTKGITIREDGLTTRAYTEQGLDLVIRQSSPHRRAVTLSHYSNPGVCFVNSLIKFLHVNGMEVPEIKGGTGSVYDEFRMGAVIDARSRAIGDFPMPYPYPFCPGMEFKPAELCLVGMNSMPRLEIRMDYGKIHISAETAKKLIAEIPEMYPLTDAFKLARFGFFEMLRDPDSDSAFLAIDTDNPQLS